MSQTSQKYSSGKQVQCYWSAPPKLDNRSHEQSKIMADAQKANRGNRNDSDNEKVHIPDTLESSDSDNDSFTIKVHKLTGMDDDQSKHIEKGQSSKQVWFVHDSIMDMDPKAIPNTTTSEISLPDKSMDLIQSDATANKTTTEKANGTSVEGATSLSPEIFIPDDNIINTQESVGAEMEVDNRSIKNLMEDGDKGDVPSSQVQKLEAGGEGTSLQ